MRPILFEVWGVPFAAWAVFFALAGFSAFFFAIALFRNLEASLKSQLPEHEAFTFVFCICYVTGWFGARALSIGVEQFEVDTFSHFFAELFRFGPMTFYGGALAAFVFGLGFVLLRRLSVGLMMDVCMPAGVLALGVGRIGCFLNGDDFGVPVLNQAQPPWWSVVFPNLGDNVARYPVQLEEALVSFLIAGCAAVYVMGSSHYKATFLPAAKRQAGNRGLVGCIVVAFSALNRFANEFYRGDLRGFFPGIPFLSTSQGVSLVLFLAACSAAVVLLVRARTRIQAEENTNHGRQLV